MKALQVEMDRAGRIDRDLFGVDGTSVRAHNAAAGAEKKGGPRNRTITR